MTLAERIFNRPDAYVARFSNAQNVVDFAKNAGRGVSVFNGTDGQFWATDNRKVASALKGAGLEQVQYRAGTLVVG